MTDDDCARIAALAPSAALGALEPGDAAFVRDHLRRCARPHPELRDAMALAAAIGWAVPDEDLPSPALRERLLARARAERDEREEPARVAVGPARPPRRSLVGWIAAGAGTVAAAAVLALAVQVSENSALRARVAESDRDVIALRAELTEAEAWIQRAVSSGATAYFMDGQGPATRASFMLVVEDDAAGAVLLMSGLPELAPDETYELWVERNGEVISAGTFSPDARGIAALAIDASVAGVRQAMITIEPFGGSETPSPDDVIMQGELST